MSNRSSPEFKLLSGNIADAVTNELDADLNYIATNVLKMRYDVLNYTGGILC